MNPMDNIYDAYGRLLRQVDEWFSECISRHPEQIRCGKGCAGCCRGLFDITLLDAWFLNRGFQKLPQDVRDKVAEKARRLLDRMLDLWPDWEEPFVLNGRPEEEWEELMPDEDETPCVLLDDAGQCLVYDHRPMTCRLHGLPLVDISGEDFHDEWCTENFAGVDPLTLTDLRYRFHDLFAEELSVFQKLMQQLLKQKINELDTFIPLALLMNFERFDWEEWAKKNLPLIRKVQEEVAVEVED